MRPVLGRVFVCLAVASGVAVGVAGAGVGRWGPSHGPEGGSVWSIVIDPANSSVVYAATGHGIFKTTNAGSRWKAVNDGLTDTSVGALAVDPSRPSVVYAGTDGGTVFKSTDGATTWHSVGKASLRVGWVETIAIDPLRPETAFAGGEKGLFKTTNGGRTWHPLTVGLTKRIVGALAIDPRTPSTLFAGASSPSTGTLHTSLFKSTDGGASWREVLLGLRGGMCGIAVDPSDPAALYAGGQTHASPDGNLFKSVDGGESWARIGGGGCSSLAVDFTRTPHVIYTTTLSSLGPMKSADGGLTWAPMGKSLPSTGWGGGSVVLDQRSPGTLYMASGGFGVFKTTSGGDPWQAVNRGLIGKRILSLAVKPHDGRTVYAGTAAGVHRSRDGGASWGAATLSKVQVGALAIDPLRPERIYAAGQGVFRSTDGARTWKSTSTGLLKGQSVMALAIDPKAPRTLYAGMSIIGWSLPPSERFGVFKSMNSGRSWRASSKGLGDQLIFAVAVDPANTTTLYAGARPYVLDTRGPLFGGGVFKSTNGGRTWKPAGLAKSFVSALAVDPQTPTTVYTVAEGIFKSTDAGRTWRKSGRGIGPVFTGSLAIDPRSPTTLYAAVCLSSACLEGPGVFRSTNGGKTWRPFNQGLRTPDVLTLAIDSTGRTLYAGTGAGVFDYRFPR